MRQPAQGWEARVRESFGRQTMMSTMQAQMEVLEPGHVVLGMPATQGLTQQHGFLHAGATTALADSACGYAAFTLAGLTQTVLTVEFKVNLLAPARGKRFTAEATVLKSGRTLTVCQATVTATDAEGGVRDIALMQATIILMEGSDR